MRLKMVNLLRSCVTTLLVVLLSGCGGGGGGGGDSAPAAKMISGIAAAGAALVGQVTVRDANGSPRSSVIEADGNYNVDVTGLTPPYRLRAEGTVGGRTYKLHSYAVEADLNGTVNITPFTDLIIANASGQIASAFFDSVVDVTLDAAELELQEAALQKKLQSVLTALGVSAAIDLLHSTFSADHSGLDAALDIIRVEVNTESNVATITNLIDNIAIEDNLEDGADNDEVFAVDETAAAALVATVTDIQQITSIFDALTAAFVGGLPAPTTIQDYFSDDFYEEDSPRALFLTEITTDPSLVGLTFSNISANVDTATATAVVTFHTALAGQVDPEPATWLAAKDSAGQWHLRGDQRIADIYFDFHCNDSDGTDSQTGACGINTSFFDNDFTNNGTPGNAPVASGTVSVIDADNGALVKVVIYLGTPENDTAGAGAVYNEASASFQGDYKGFGVGPGVIDSRLIGAGDTIRYDLYTQALDLSNPNFPQIAAGAMPVASYTDKVLFDPATTGLYPIATAESIAAIAAFEAGDNEELLLQISDSLGNRVQVYARDLTSENSKTIASAQLDSAAIKGAGLDPDAQSYELLVRIYAIDPLTAQRHSTTYYSTIAGPGATGSVPEQTLACNTESGWNDAADGGQGAPVVPYSFADFEAVIAGCGGAMTIDYTAVAGRTFVDDFGSEEDSFAAISSSPTAAARGTGTHTETEASIVIPFTWYLEDAGNHNYLVREGTDGVTIFRETIALLSASGAVGQAGTTYTFKAYSEQDNYSTDGLTRGTGTDGEIWTPVLVQQQ
jgi:hypothetical protein